MNELFYMVSYLPTEDTLALSDTQIRNEYEEDLEVFNTRLEENHIAPIKPRYDRPLSQQLPDGRLELWKVTRKND